MGYMPKDAHSLDSLIHHLQQLRDSYGNLPVCQYTDMGEIWLSLDSPNVEEAEDNLPRRVIF